MHIRESGESEMEETGAKDKEKDGQASRSLRNEGLEVEERMQETEVG